MKKDKTDHFDLFYVSLPYFETLPADYPTDVEIQHAYEEPSTSHGLSSDQVSALAQDGLESIKRHHKNPS